MAIPTAGTSRLIQITLLMFIVSSLVTGGLIEVALPALVQGPMHGSAGGFGFILAGWGGGRTHRVHSRWHVG
ncbi:MAG TPA: hypothetical protein VFN35_21280 [Ktedonobacteraceae bacterium]|nr:hypothetical protein [Ktedonobacteraceae bacterium]